MKRWTNHKLAGGLGLLFIVMVVVVLVVASSGRKPEALRHLALRAEAAAQKAFEKHDAGGAELAAAQAEEALDQLKHLVDPGKAGGASAEKMLQDTREAAGSARNYAALALEEEQCRKRLDTLKLKAYQHARETICSFALAGLAPAADRFAHSDTNTMSAPERQLAALAWQVVEWLDDQAPLTNGAPDWATAAQHLRAAANGSPPRLSLLLALAFGLGGFSDFGLCEIESVEVPRLTSANAQALYHLERGAFYAAQGWDHTATREFSIAANAAPGGWDMPGSTQAVALLHFWLADRALETKNFRQANVEVEHARKLWPESPLEAFLSADQLLAAGDWEKAAAMLVASAAKTKNQWLANRLNQRAQEISESKGAAPLLFSDPALLRDAALHTFGDSVRDLSNLLKLADVITTGRALGRRLLEQLPGGSGG